VDAIRRLTLAGGEVGRFHDPARGYLHPEDVDIALDISRFNFAVRVEFEDGRPGSRVWRGQPDAEDRSDYSSAILMCLTASGDHRGFSRLDRQAP
jgi:hypothetical protein